VRFIVAGDKFGIKTLLCNTLNFYVVDSDLQLNNKHRMPLLHFHYNNGYANVQQCHVVSTWPVLCVISGFRRDVDAICGLMGYCGV